MSSQDADISNAYGYAPNLPANIVACVLFGIILLVQLILGGITHDWWMFVTWGITAGLEFAGYIARALSHKYVYSLPLYEMQLVCLMFAPAFMAAGIYYQLAKEISIYGKRYSPLKPMMYTAICTTCDVISIIIQAAGGGKASADVNYNIPGFGISTGGWIMVAGIAFQVFSLSCFTVLFAYVTWNVFSDPHPETNWNPDFKDNRGRLLFNYWLPALSVSLLFLLIRSIYRIVELSVGWGGYLMQKERYFLILDGLMIVLSMAPLTIIYPALAYGDDVPVEGLHYKEGEPPKFKRRPPPSYNESETSELPDLATSMKHGSNSTDTDERGIVPKSQRFILDTAKMLDF